MAEQELHNPEVSVLGDIVTTPYKFGFKTDIETEEFPKGINGDIIDSIIAKKKEPVFLKKFRKKAFSTWQKMKSPDWSYLKIPPIDYQDIQY